FAKVRLLLNTKARIVAYSDRPEADYHAFLIANRIETVRAAFACEQVEGSALVFAATGNEADDRSIVDAARAARIPA
ncbi:NAD(P)-dependent oxidoreductase, partial [Rhizobium ruizarguesonis]